MPDCSFSIAFDESPDLVLNKAKTAVQHAGGIFTGDINSGNFSVTVFGNNIKGSYSVQAKNLDIIIDSKPFFLPCSAIESFLRNKIAGY